MTDKVSGRCLCGSVRFEVEKQGLFGGTLCHCRDCQYASGGGPAIVVATQDATFRKLQGKTKSFTVSGGSGNDVTRKHCSQCGTPMFSELTIAPGITIIKIGTFDDPGFFDQQMTVWTSSAQPWAHIDPDLPSFPKAPQ